MVKIVAVIDREEGARENIEAAGFPFEALFTKGDLGMDLGSEISDLGSGG